MRIAMLTELFPPSIGGQEVRFAELANALADKGHSVQVLCIKHVATLPEQETLASGVTVIREPYLPNYRQMHGKLLPRSLPGMLRYAFAVWRWLSRERFDLIFLNQWPLLHVLALPRRARRCAVIDWCEIRDSGPYRLFQALLPRLVAANTAVSTDVQRHIAAHSRGPVLMLPSGIARERYSAADPASRRGVLYLGRLAHHKGVPLLIASYEELCRHGFAEPLIIAGAGPEQEAIQAAVTASPYAAQITMAGMVSEERKLELLSAARVLVLPSQREGFPRVVAEAMASGLPTVTTRYAGNGTVGVVEEFQCGLCADPEPAAVAAAIAAVYSDWGVYSARAEAGAARLDWAAIVVDFERLADQILNEPISEQIVSLAKQQIVEQ